MKTSVKFCGALWNTVHNTQQKRAGSRGSTELKEPVLDTWAGWAAGGGNRESPPIPGAAQRPSGLWATGHEESVNLRATWKSLPSWLLNRPALTLRRQTSPESHRQELSFKRLYRHQRTLYSGARCTVAYQLLRYQEAVYCRAQAARRNSNVQATAPGMTRMLSYLPLDVNEAQAR